MSRGWLRTIRNGFGSGRGRFAIRGPITSRCVTVARNRASAHLGKARNPAGLARMTHVFDLGYDRCDGSAATTPDQAFHPRGRGDRRFASVVALWTFASLRRGGAGLDPDAVARCDRPAG